MGHAGTRRVMLGWVMCGTMAWAGLSEADLILSPQASAGWVIETADYTGTVSDRIVKLTVDYTVQAIRDGWMEIPLTLEGAKVTAVEIRKKMGEAYVAPRGDAYVLVASRKGRYRVHMQCSARLTQGSQFEGLQLGIPRATFSTLVLSVPRKDVELRQEDELYVERQPDAPRDGVKLTAHLGAAASIDLQWRTKPAAPAKVDPVLYGEVHTLVTVEEQLARFLSVIAYRVAQGETRELLVQLSPTLNLLNVRGAGIDDWRVSDADGRRTLVVTLSNALKDATYQLALEGEETITDGSDAYALPRLQLTGVKQERGFLAVARAGNIELSARTAEGINRVDVKELPEFLRTASAGPAILAFKYHQHPYQVTLAMTRHQDHAVLAAIAERGELATVISQRGELLTRATYLIKANKKQYVGVVLPKGATLWSCLVEGRSVKPVEREHQELLVPLDTSAEMADTVSVELVYFERRPRLTRIGSLNLQGPLLDVPTTIANWSVYAPQEIRVVRTTGNVERGLAAFEFLEEPFVQTAFAQGATAPRAGGDVGSKPADRSDRRAAMERDRDTLAQVKRRLAASRGDRMIMENTPDEFSLRDREAYKRARSEAQANTPSAFAANGLMPGAGGPNGDSFVAAMGAFVGRIQETGILPLKIRLPKSGRVYRFSRLMTSHDALSLEMTFIRLATPWVIAAGFGLALIPAAGVTVSRLIRR